MADAKRQLQIKTAGLKRVTKELAVYIREEDAESVRVKTLRASGADSHDVKHAVSRGGLTWLRGCRLLDAQQGKFQTWEHTSRLVVVACLSHTGVDTCACPLTLPVQTYKCCQC